jgi:hypothetical protein
MPKQLPAGRPLTYSEILRVIGRYADRAHLSGIRIIETDDGLIVQGRVLEGPRAGAIDTYQLTSEDVIELRADALAERGTRL